MKKTYLLLGIVIVIFVSAWIVYSKRGSENISTVNEISTADKKDNCLDPSAELISNLRADYERENINYQKFVDGLSNGQAIPDSARVNFEKTRDEYFKAVSTPCKKWQSANTVSNTTNSKIYESDVIARDPGLLGVWHAERVYGATFGLKNGEEWMELGQSEGQRSETSSMYVKFEKDRMCAQHELDPLKVDCDVLPILYTVSERSLALTINGKTSQVGWKRDADTLELVSLNIGFPFSFTGKERAVKTLLRRVQ